MWSYIKFHFSGGKFEALLLGQGISGLEGTGDKGSIYPPGASRSQVPPAPMSTRVCGKLCFHVTVCWPDKLIWEPCILAQLLSCYFVP